ncbi:hypothetical protein [Kiloniella majae]|nr:hypothetical protein [Kiloniella majae]
MIARIWTARFDLAKSDTLKAYADSKSLPFLSSVKGNCGVLFLTHEDEWQTITFWHNEADYLAMESDPAYQALNQGILNIDAIKEVISVKIFNVDASKGVADL